MDKSRIPYHGKKFFKRTISGYSKEKILHMMVDSIHNGHKKLAIYSCIELMCSGFYDEILKELFVIMSKYCHIHMPILPKYFVILLQYYESAKQQLEPDKQLIDLRNDLHFRNTLEVLVILLCDCKKQFILPKHYQKYFAPMDVLGEEVEDVLKKFKKTLWKLTSLESFNKTKHIENQIMMYLGFILNDQTMYEQLWNILLEFAKFIPHKHILEHVSYLYQIYTMVPYVEKIFLPLYATLYFFKGTWIKLHQFKEPKQIRHEFYKNIRDSALNNTRRRDFLNLKKPIQPQLSKLKNPPILQLPIQQPKPIPEPIPEPVSEPIPEPVSEPIPEPIPEPVSEPIPEPVSEPIPEPVSEPIPEPIPEPTPEDENVVVIPIRNYRLGNSQSKQNVKVSCIDEEEENHETTFW